MCGGETLLSCVLFLLHVLVAPLQRGDTWKFPGDTVSIQCTDYKHAKLGERNKKREAREAFPPRISLWKGAGRRGSAGECWVTSDVQLLCVQKKKNNTATNSTQQDRSPTVRGLLSCIHWYSEHLHLLPSCHSTHTQIHVHVYVFSYLCAHFHIFFMLVVTAVYMCVCVCLGEERAKDACAFALHQWGLTRDTA